MHPLATLSLTLLILLGFLGILAWIITVKFSHLLKALRESIKLEFYDPIGLICLAGLMLIGALFLILFMEGSGLELVKAFLKPELVAHSVNATVGFLIVAGVFLGNLVVLLLLNRKRP